MIRSSERLGEKMTIAAFSVRGLLSPDRAWDLAWKLVAALGMNAVSGATLSSYPLDGKGGKGFTLFQPLTESFVALDAWDEFSGAYVFLCSCKHFSLWDVETLIERQGFEVTGNLLGTLGLKG